MEKKEERGSYLEGKYRKNRRERGREKEAD